MSAGAERFFYRLMLTADDYGLFVANARYLTGTCFALHNDVDVDDVGRWLEELHAADIVHLYKSGGRDYGCFPNWSKHNRTRAKKPKYPTPTKSVSNVSAACQQHADKSPQHAAYTSLYDLNTNTKGKDKQPKRVRSPKGPSSESQAWSIARTFYVAGIETGACLSKQNWEESLIPKWANCLDQVHRIDKQTWSDIRDVCEFIVRDKLNVGPGQWDGWHGKANPCTLRKETKDGFTKFEKILKEAKSTRGPKPEKLELL